MNRYFINCLGLIILINIGCSVTNNLDTYKLSGTDYLSEYVDKSDDFCYSQTDVYEPFVFDKTHYPLYINKEYIDMTNVITVQIQVKEATTKKVKVKADKNCLSADPNDCLTWVIREEPARYKTWHIVADTSINKNFELVPVGSGLSRTEQYSISKPVMCYENLTSELIGDIQSALIKRRFHKNKITYDLDEATQIALYNFQEASGLTIGHLDSQTLDALEINY